MTAKMKEMPRSILTEFTTSSKDADDDFRKLSLGSSVLEPASKGFIVNLLANSLSTKLKQHNLSVDDFQATFFPKKYKFHRYNPHSCSGDLNRAGSQLLENEENKLLSPRRPCSTVSADGEKGRLPSGISNSVSESDEPRGLSVRSKASKMSSRGSSSAGQFKSASSQGTSQRALRRLGHDNEMVQDSSMGFYRSSESSAKLIKRDGIFQVADKYAPGRHELRDISHQYRKPACDYDMYVLPPCRDENAEFTQNVNPRNDFSPDKKRAVSWNVIEQNTNNAMLDGDETDTRFNAEQTAATPNNTQRPVSKDYFAYRRPVYSTGKSKVASIGLKWMMPTTVEREQPVKVQRTRKPMWSWLVTNEAKQQPPLLSNPRAKPPVCPHPTRSDTSSRSGSNLNVRTRHSRDVHPVSTAMEREGTSVSKTRWKVPGSVGSTIDAEKTVMERLELVKRPGSRLLYDQNRNFEYSAKKYKEWVSQDQEIAQSSKSETKHTMNSDEQMGDTSSSSPQREYQNSSPAKSRSTNYN